jgi:hypothetical protein
MASAVLPFANDLPDESGSSLIINRIPSWQGCAVQFGRPLLAVLACADNPGRTAKIFAKQTRKALADAVELRPYELIDSRRQAIPVSHQCAQPPQLLESKGGYAYGLAFRRDQGMSPLRCFRRKGKFGQCSGLGHWSSYSRQRTIVILIMSITLVLP